MKRRNFIKKLFGIGVGAAAMATIPAIANNDEEFTIEELFDRCSGNGQLFFLKTDSWIEDEIKNIIGDRFVDKKYFNFYEPLYNCYLPIKEKYTKKDFENFFLVVKSKKFDYFCDYVGNGGKPVGALSLIRDDKNGHYRTELYHARNPQNNY